MATPEFKDKMQRSTWCWSNHAHAHTALFFYDEMSKGRKDEIKKEIASGKYANWFDAIQSYNVESLYSRWMNSDTENLQADSLTHRILGTISAQDGVKLRPGVSEAKAEHRIWKAVRSRNLLTISDMAQIIDSAFQFPNDDSAKQECLSTAK